VNKIRDALPNVISLPPVPCYWQHTLFRVTYAVRKAKRETAWEWSYGSKTAGRTRQLLLVACEAKSYLLGTGEQQPGLLHAFHCCQTLPAPTCGVAEDIIYGKTHL